MTTVGLDTQPSAISYDLEDLVYQAWRGDIRLPHFQRDFRWGTEDVIRLFDSVSKGYPIGSLLLWIRRSPAAQVILGSLEIDAPASDQALWVVDGQQRITSLANALHPDGNRYPPFNVAYDLVHQEFVSTPRGAAPDVVPLPVLFDLEKLLGWFSENGSTGPESFAEARRMAKLLRQYRVPVTVVRRDDVQTMIDIFDRINNSGKRLSRVEVFSALFAGTEHGVGGGPSISSVVDNVAARTGFGRLDDDTVLSSILVRRGPDPSRNIRSEFTGRGASDFPGEEPDVAYREGEHAIVRAVEFLQADAGVPHVSMLAYRALLVVLTRFFAHFPTPADRSRQLLRRVYWRGAVSGPVTFKGNFTNITRVLGTKIHPGDEDGSVQRLVEALNAATPVVPSPVRFKTNEATTKIVLCSWWALGPRSPLTGSRYDAQELALLLADQTTASLAVRRIFTHGPQPDQALWAANHLFAPTTVDPVDDFPAMLSRHVHEPDDSWAAVLASYCLTPGSADQLAHGNVDEFLNSRQRLIGDELRRFLDRMAEWDYEDTPPLDSLDLDDAETDTDDAG